MNLVRVQHNAISALTLLAGGMLALVVDSRPLAYVIGACALVISAAYGWLAAKKQFDRFPLIHHLSGAFFVWAGFSSVFAIRAFQLVSLTTIVILGVALSITAGFLWVEHDEKENRILWYALAVLTFEWFVIFLFAPAHYIVLGGLTMIAFTSTALLFDAREHSEKKLTYGVVVRHLLLTAAAASLFIFGFTWVL